VVQLRAPWFHSWYKPRRRTKKKKSPIEIQDLIKEVFIIRAIGRMRAISTSKIKKIIAIKKNRIEKGRRADLLGSNPHSKGDLFSRSLIIFFANKDANDITRALIIIVKIIHENDVNITSSNKLDSLIGSQA
jgi:hypothetical protein